MQGYKTDFPLLMQDKTVYIDNAATAQRPKCVIDAEKDFYTCHNANPCLLYTSDAADEL